MCSRSAGREPTTTSWCRPRVSRSRCSDLPDPDGKATTISSNRSKSSGEARWTRSGFLCRRAAARASRRLAADPSNHPAPRSSRRTSRKPKAAAERRLDPTSTWSCPISSKDGRRSSGRRACACGADPWSTYQPATAAAAATLRSSPFEIASVSPAFPGPMREFAAKAHVVRCPERGWRDLAVVLCRRCPGRQGRSRSR